MKFSTIVSTLAVIASTVINPVAAYETTNDQHAVDVLVDFQIVETPEVTNADVANWFNGDSMTLAYSIENNEQNPITVIGVTGQFKNPITGEVITNLTTGRIEPLAIEVGQTDGFEQVISVNLIPGNYELVPYIFFAEGEVIKALPVRGQLVTVAERPISLFDPRLILVELILVASAVGVLYIGYELWGKNYIRGTAPVVAPKKAASPSSGVSSGRATPSGSSYDVNWIPEGHLKQTKTKKAT